MKIKKRYREKIVLRTIALFKEQLPRNKLTYYKSNIHLKYIKLKEIICLIKNFNNYIEIHDSWYKLIEYQLSRNYLWIVEFDVLSTNLFLNIHELSYFCVSDDERMFLATIKP